MKITLSNDLSQLLNRGKIGYDLSRLLSGKIYSTEYCVKKITIFSRH